MATQRLTREHRARWRALPYTDADHPGWRRLAAAVLLHGYQDHDAAFVHSEWACHLAELLDLPDWPPARFVSRAQLVRRRRQPSTTSRRWW